MKLPISRLLGHKSKKKGHFTFSNFKSWRKESVLSFFYLWPRSQDIGILFTWRYHVLHFLSFKRQNGHISVPDLQIKKLRTLSFLQLLKFEKAKYPYFFIYGQGAKILALFLVTVARTPPPEDQKTQWLWFGYWATNQKTKDTFFSSSLKVWESKVSLFFNLWPRGRDIGLSSGHDGTFSSSWGSKDAMDIIQLLGHK